MQTLLLVLDLCGTFVFAVSGAVAANRRQLDLFGVLVLSTLAGNSGGIVRDVLIGAIPPSAINDWRYLAVSVAAGLITFYWNPVIDRLHHPMLIFDAAGLGLFAVSGTQKALEFNLHPIMAAALGVLTGTGGGMARDLFLAQIPTVLHTDFYAMGGTDRCRCGRGWASPGAAAIGGGARRRPHLLWSASRRDLSRLASSNRRQGMSDGTAARWTRIQPLSEGNKVARFGARVGMQGGM
jgi:uncharacterized membrane protein YeiH